MLHRLTYDGVALPALYVAGDESDAAIARGAGLPYVVWNKSDRDLVRLVLVQYMRERFPHVRLDMEEPRNQPVVWCSGAEKGQWKPQPENNEAQAETPEEEEDEPQEAVTDGSPYAACPSKRECAISGSTGSVKPVDLYQYVGDPGNYVDIEVLADLGLMPAFVSDVAASIRRELEGQCVWTEGYNKKRGVPIGNFDRAESAPNLLIIDVSRSIPAGIAATMLMLAETLRERMGADLIVTGAKSYLWRRGEALPSAERLRLMVPPSNETDMFQRLIEDEVEDEYGNVVCFGDYDHPYIRWTETKRQVKVRRIVSYHTNRNGWCKHKKNVAVKSEYDPSMMAGYCRWAKEMNPDAEVEYHLGDWCEMLRE